MTALTFGTVCGIFALPRVSWLVRLETLKSRRDFLRVRGGARWVSDSFVLEAKRRPDDETEPRGPRFGFTVTKKLGNAVVRNRIRRRLREAVRDIATAKALPTFDYIIVARGPALVAVFRTLVNDLSYALDKVHAHKRSKAAE